MAFEILSAADAAAFLNKANAKSIAYQTIDRAKAGAFGRVKFIGFLPSSDTDGDFVFKSESGQTFNIRPFALIQRKESTTAEAPVTEFSDGVLKELGDGGIAPATAISNWLYAHSDRIFVFGQSAPKTIAIWRKAKGAWELRPNSTDLVLREASAPAPAPTSAPW